MNSRERVFTALAHQEPDRPPISATYTPETTALLRGKFGREEEDLGFVMGNDLIKVAVGMENSYYMTDQSEYTCPFGVKWKYATNYTGTYTEIVGGALEDDEDGDKLASYQLPDPDDPALYAKLRKTVERYGKEKFIIGSCQCSVFETAWYLHGMQDTLMDMAANEEYAQALFDKIMRFPLRAGLNMIEAGADMIWLGDDVATQREMMFSPDMWRRYFKPRYAEMFAAFRAAKPGVALAYHSCGNCEAILDDMIEIGLTVLNPIQPLAMDPYHIKKRYGKNLTLFGALDVQKLLPFGTPAEVAATVRDYQKYLGAGGGYIISPAHHLQSDTPLENILAFYETAMERAQYDPKYL